jgi:hypothetical protein
MANVNAALATIEARHPNARIASDSGTPASTPPKLPKRDTHGSSDQQTSGIGHPQVIRKTEHQRADTGEERRHRAQASWTDPVRKKAAGDLHHRVGVEIGGRQVPEQGAADGKFPHQLVDHHGRSDALKKPEQVETGHQPPHQPGHPDRCETGHGWDTLHGDALYDR